MSVVRLGATRKYSENWDNIFSGKRSAGATTKTAKKSAKPARKSPKKSAKAAKKSSGKKSSKRK